MKNSDTDNRRKRKDHREAERHSLVAGSDILDQFK
jgi:hypothetical protein